MPILFFIILFFVSFIGIAALFGRHFKSVHSFSGDEISKKLADEEEFFADFRVGFVLPASRFLHNVLKPGFFDLTVGALGHTRSFISKVESRIEKLTDYLHGKRASLDNEGKPSAHWKDMNEWKNNNNGEKEDKGPDKSPG